MTATNNTNGMPAVVVEDLRKEFFRNDGREGLRRRRKRVARLLGRGSGVAVTARGALLIPRSPPGRAWR